MNQPDIQRIACNPSLSGMAEALPNIVYSSAAGAEVALTLLLPWGARERGERLPLIVFIQGSGFTFPNVGYQLPQLGWYAQNGYAVATLTHRSCLDGHPFPAYIQDVKTAVRFLKKHADEYAIDASRICAWGTSSGGNTALLLGLTADDPAFKTGEHADQSDAVNLVVECFGPTDLVKMLDGADPDAPVMEDIFLALAAGRDMRAVMRDMSPVYYLAPGRAYPPALLIHGDADDVVPHEQMVLMYRALQAHGVDARAITVEGAPHEGSFWSRELHDVILGYLREKL
ncbi:prolyl oligopeptidase family serine peptidase [Bacillota bacterium Meth-B3]